MPADTDIAILEERLYRRRRELTEAEAAERSLKEACDSLRGEWLEARAELLSNKHEYLKSFVTKWLDACETLTDARRAVTYCETAIALAQRLEVRS